LVGWEYFLLRLLLGLGLLFFALARRSRSSRGLLFVLGVELGLFFGFLAFFLHYVQCESIFAISSYTLHDCADQEVPLRSFSLFTFPSPIEASAVPILLPASCPGT
jgi:hypothetical protein